MNVTAERSSFLLPRGTFTHNPWYEQKEKYKEFFQFNVKST